MKVFARDIMQTNVKTVPWDLPMADLERRFVEDQVSGFPVVDEDGQVQGVVSARDILQHVCEERDEVEWSSAFWEEELQVEFATFEDEWVSAEVGKRTDQLTAGDLMCDQVISVSSEMPVHDVAAKMSDKKVHRLLVIDDGKLAGIISSSDIVRVCANDDVDVSFAAPKILDF